MVAVPAVEAGDIVRRNLWSDSGRGVSGPGAPGAAVCAGGAGPGHSSGRTAALRAGAACGSAAEVRRTDDRTNRGDAVRVRCGIARAGKKSARRKTDGAQSDQAACQELEAGLFAGLAGLRLKKYCGLHRL